MIRRRPELVALACALLLASAPAAAQVHRHAPGWSVVVEWGAPEFSKVYGKPVVWRTSIDRVHYASAVVEISRPTTPPVKPGHH